MARPFYELPEEQRENFKADLKFGLSAPAIEEKYGLPRGGLRTLIRLSKEVGLPWGEMPWREQWTQWWKEGVSRKEIGRRTQMDAENVQRRFNKLGLGWRASDGGVWDKATREAYARDWLANVPLKELAKRYDRPIERLRAYRVRNKLPMRPIDYTDGKQPYTPEEDAELRRLYATGAAPIHIVNAPIFANRTADSIQQRAMKLGLRRNHKRGRATPETVAPKIKACLVERGAASVFQIGLYAEVKDPRIVHAALRQLKRANEVVQVRRGVWDVVR